MNKLKTNYSGDGVVVLSVLRVLSVISRLVHWLLISVLICLYASGLGIWIMDNVITNSLKGFAGGYLGTVPYKPALCLALLGVLLLILLCVYIAFFRYIVLHSDCSDKYEDVVRVSLRGVIVSGYLLVVPLYAGLMGLSCFIHGVLGTIIEIT